MFKGLVQPSGEPESLHRRPVLRTVRSRRQVLPLRSFKRSSMTVSSSNFFWW